MSPSPRLVPLIRTASDRSPRTPADIDTIARAVANPELSEGDVRAVADRLAQSPAWDAVGFSWMCTAVAALASRRWAEDLVQLAADGDERTVGRIRLLAHVFAGPSAPALLARAPLLGLLQRGIPSGVDAARVARSPSLRVYLLGHLRGGQSHWKTRQQWARMFAAHPRVLAADDVPTGMQVATALVLAEPVDTFAPIFRRVSRTTPSVAARVLVAASAEQFATVSTDRLARLLASPAVDGETRAGLGLRIATHPPSR